MIKTQLAHTHEIDDTELAVSEILGQLDLAGLKAHSVGILTCFADFVSEGVVEALCAALPFPVVGMTTLASCVGDQVSTTMLTCTVLTSDEVSFAVGLSEPVTQSDPSLLADSYRQAAAALPDKPGLMLAFIPLLTGVGGDFFVDSLREISGGVPLFGAMSVDHTSDYRHSRVLYEGEAYPDRLAFVLVQGDIHPRFYIAQISDETIFRDKGVVTRANGNQLQTVNDMPVSDYLLSLGLTKNAEGQIEGINSFPFVVDYGDGTQPVVRVMFALTPEGYAVCGGDIPVGATISVGTIDAAEVLDTTEGLLGQVRAHGPADVALFFSCVGRYFAQGFDTTAELDKVTGAGLSGLPYTMCYAGGEVCPVYDKGGNTTNRNHNDTFVACLF